MADLNLKLLSCEGLCVGYAEPLFAPFSFELNPGEVVALMGENGCGKSTLLKTFAGQMDALGGSILLDGLPLHKWNVRERACRVALVRMSGMVPDRMNVREFVSLGRSPYSGFLDGRSAEDWHIVEESMSLLDVACFAQRSLSELSDGERSRVYLAEAVAQRVKVLLLDEPNAFLDIPRSKALFRLLKKLAGEFGMGVVVSTHSVEYAQSYCDRIMSVYGNTVRVGIAREAIASGLLDWALAE